MKKIVLALFVLILIVGSAFAFSFVKKQNEEPAGKKILVAYYSWSGQTRAVAENIKDITKGDIFEIIPKVPYSNDRKAVYEQAKQEKENNIFVEIQNKGEVKNYDIIFIGTPNWYSTMATPVKTFLKENNFKGKTIVPFCTHGGSGVGSIYSDMQNLAPNAKFLEGFAAFENSAKTEDIEKWITGLNL